MTIPAKSRLPRTHPTAIPTTVPELGLVSSVVTGVWVVTDDADVTAAIDDGLEAGVGLAVAIASYMVNCVSVGVRRCIESHEDLTVLAADAVIWKSVARKRIWTL